MGEECVRKVKCVCVGEGRAVGCCGDGWLATGGS